MSQQLKLSISIFKEGNSFIAYLPSLDLSTSGKTFKEVKQRAKEIIEVFFEELAEAGTTQEVLENLGWAKVKQQIKPPVIVAHEIQEIKMPAFAYA